MEASKFLRIGGRGDDGNAKPLAMDDYGNIVFGRNKLHQETLFDGATSNTTTSINVSGYTTALLIISGEDTSTGFDAWIDVVGNFPGKVSNNFTPTNLIDGVGNAIRYARKPGMYRVDVSAIDSLRVRIREYNEGTINVVAHLVADGTSYDIQLNTESAYKALYNNSIPSAPFRSWLFVEKDISTLQGAMDYGAATDSASGRAIIMDDNDVDDLRGIEYFRHLLILRVENNDVSKIGPLDELVHLSEITLPGANIETIGKLNRLVNLEIIDLDNTGVSDIGNTASLTKVETLRASNSNLDRIDISNMADLHTFQVANANLAGTVEETVGVFDDKPNIFRILLHNNFLSGAFTGLDKMAGIDRFFVHGNEFSQSDIEDAIDQFHSIRNDISGATLNFSNNPGSDGAATSKATEITELENAGVTVII